MGWVIFRNIAYFLICVAQDLDDQQRNQGEYIRNQQRFLLRTVFLSFLFIFGFRV